jgi:hypothetical protein
MVVLALVALAVAGARGAELLNSDLYLSSSRCVRPPPRGFYRPCRSTRSLHCISAAPAAFDRYLAALPAMSLDPLAPLYLSSSRCVRPLGTPPESRSHPPAIKYECGSHLDPLAPLKLCRCPHSIAATLAVLPSMSLIPFAPFSTKKPVHLRRGSGKATLPMLTVSQLLLAAECCSKTCRSRSIAAIGSVPSLQQPCGRAAP